MVYLKKILFFSLFTVSILIAQTVPVTLHYKPTIPEFTTLRLVGNFNGWNNNDDTMIMTDPDGDGVYEITKDFAIGVEHLYKFVFDANWGFAWNDPDNPDIKTTDNNNSILNVKDPFLTYLLPRGKNTLNEVYVDTTIGGEPIRAIFTYTDANPINLTSMIVRIDGAAIENPGQYFNSEKKEFYYQPPVPLAEGDHTVIVSASSSKGSIFKMSTFTRKPGAIVYKTPVDFYYDEYNTASSVFQSINSVSLVGNFNNWNEVFDPLQDKNKDGLWEATAFLEEGSYEYLFKLNKSLWVKDPDEPTFSAINENNAFSVTLDTLPTIKLIAPNESSTFELNPAEINFKALLRPGVKSTVDESSIVVKLDGLPVTATFDADSGYVRSSIIITGEGAHQISVEFANANNFITTETYTYGIHSGNTGFYYADAINDEPYFYPTNVPQGSCDILSLLIDEVSTHDSLAFSVQMEEISDRTRLGLIITNPVSTSASAPLGLDVVTEDWQNNGVFIPIGKPGNAFENTTKENIFWVGRDPEVYSNKHLNVNSNAVLNNSFEFTISVAYLDSLLGSWTRERNIYLFSYLANEDKSGNSFEVTSAEGGSDKTEDPDIYDAAFFRSGFWQNRVFANFIPAGDKMGPRTVSLNGNGRGRNSFIASNISDSLSTYGPAINFYTPSVTYWYPNVNVKGDLSDPNITTATFSFNGIESEISIVDSKFDVPVVLNNGENIIFVKATDNKGFESISKNLYLYYEKNDQTTATINGSVDGRSVTLSAYSSSLETLSFGYLWTEDDKNPATLFGSSDDPGVQFTVPDVEGEYYINVRISGSDGSVANARKLIFAKDGSVSIAQNNDHASWINSAVVYEIYPRSYSSTGNFAGIQNKIPDMLSLGINTIWLMPIYTGPTTHGYEITDYFGFEEDFGDAEDFTNLVTALHNAGIKVILDFVVNHTSVQHPFMQNVLEYGSNSPWADFYIWDGEPGNSNYAYYFDWGSLPNLNHNNKDVRDYFIKAALYWVKEFDIDGYRCDVAWGVEERNTQFWQEWRSALKNIKPELFLEAEASSAEPIFYENRFDSANDWDLRNDIINTTNNTLSVEAMDAELRKSYPSYARPFRFIENHDEVRVASSHDTQRSKLMHTILMTANGVPLIYSGGEVGELTNRDLIDWTDPDNLKPYFKSIIKIRNKYLANPVLSRITTSLPSDVYAYISASGLNNILTLANFKNTEKNVSINIGDLPLGTKYLTNLVDGTVIDIQPLSGAVALDFNAFEAKVFYLGEEPVSVDSEENQDLIIDEYQLSQNYPNPFNPSTQITYQIPEAGLVTIKVFDILGREVTTLVNREMAVGKYDVYFNASNLSSGIYFYTMKTGKFINTKKLVLLK